VGSSQLDADALDLLALAALVVSDRETWTRDYRAALRWKRSNRKPLHMAPEHHPREEYRTISSSPRDDRATAWSLVGALELVADFPDPARSRWIGGRLTELFNDWPEGSRPPTPPKSGSAGAGT